jgi:Tfp pilus assembly protein FimT
LHFIFNQDLIPQATYKVTLAAGVTAANGDVMTSPFAFNFTARPKAITSHIVINDFNTAPPHTTGSSRWLEPRNTGQNTGFNGTQTVATTDNNIKPRIDHTGSARFNYQWLSTATNSSVVRWHPDGSTVAACGNTFVPNAHGHIQYYLHGDGSGTPVSMMLQNNFGNPLFGYRIVVDWVGWRQITVDVLNDSRVAELNTTGTGDFCSWQKQLEWHAVQR